MLCQRRELELTNLSKTVKVTARRRRRSSSRTLRRLRTISSSAVLPRATGVTFTKICRYRTHGCMQLPRDPFGHWFRAQCLRILSGNIQKIYREAVGSHPKQRIVGILIRNRRPEV